MTNAKAEAEAAVERRDVVLKQHRERSRRYRRLLEHPSPERLNENLLEGSQAALSERIQELEL